MGCQLNFRNESLQNFTEEQLYIKLTPRGKKLEINQIRIRPQAIITQYKRFPEDLDHQNHISKGNSRGQLQIFNSNTYIPLSTILHEEQPQSPDLTSIMLIKQMEFNNKEIIQETRHLIEHPQKCQKKRKSRRIDMKKPEAQF